MKFKEIKDIIGQQLAQHYAHLGFKYSKNWGVVRKNKAFKFVIDFNSFSGNTKNSISFGVAFSVMSLSVKDFRGDLGVGLTGYGLWGLGFCYEIGESHTIEEVVKDIIKHADILLIPHIDRFEKDSEKHKEQWITAGFSAHLSTTEYRPVHTDYTTHLHYWNGTDFFNRNPFGFDISLPYICERFGKETAEICLKNYFQSLNEDAQKNFAQAYFCEKENNKDWGLTYQELPDIGLVKYAVMKGISFQ